MTADWSSLVETGEVWVLCINETQYSDPDQKSIGAREVIGSVLLQILSENPLSLPRTEVEEPEMTEEPRFEQPLRSLLLDDIVVSPDHQGKGYGRKLMQFAEDMAREKGCARVRLYTNVKMWENMELYRKWGFREVERRVEEGFERVFYEKSV